MAQIATETVGRRTYIRGNTYPHRDALRDAGCHWDGQARAWWIGSADKAAELVASLAPAAAEPAANGGERKEPGLNATVAGRAEYKGKTYYIAGRIDRGDTRYDDRVHVVETRDGAKVLLYSRDGKLQFWAAREAVSTLKRYDYPQTIRSLREYAEKAKQARGKAADASGDEDDECHTCERNFRSGRWAPYCGSGDYDDCPTCGQTVEIRY